MKDECAGALISEVVCLRSKMYSILLENGKKKHHKSKGHNESGYQEANNALKLQVGLVQQVCLQTRNEHAPKR